MRGLLVVGTDTGVGKTTVSCGLLRLAHRRGFRLVPYKPAETGCLEDIPEDARRLLQASLRNDLSPDDICPFPFQPPVAPSVAARLAGTQIDLGVIHATAQALALRADALLVEAAGGLLTPYGPGLAAAHLADLLAVDVLLVSANRLGTINHTALALAEIKRRRLSLAGVVLVNTALVPSPDAPWNRSEIQAHTGIAPLGVLRHVPGADADLLADAVQADLDLRGLFGGALTRRLADPHPSAG